MAVTRRVPALKVHQWLSEWDDVLFDPKNRRRRPDPHFYLFSIRASTLRALSGISRRTTEHGLRRSEDIGIQRRHDVERSEIIRDFIRYGYPWSALNLSQRQAEGFRDLRKPGWLPTAIVVNLLRSQDSRRGKHVHASDLITLAPKEDNLVEFILPKSFKNEGWTPSELHPIEVIDGQHRLWAFDEDTDSDFDLPVVAFYGLDISWQAYLFWTINITPKRINASLAFDLYPLLRTEDWLEKFEGPRVYRETRAQELTENLWAHPKSPWHNRINMLGETGLKGVLVTQAAWIRSLLATYIKSFEGKRITIGGLFGAPIGQNRTTLPWTRSQQAAFLILVWSDLQDQIKSHDSTWTRALRKGGVGFEGQDPAFTGGHTLLNTDQGVRGVLYISNDLCFLAAEELDLLDWIEEDVDSTPSNDLIWKALSNLRRKPVTNFLSEVNHALATFDWRTSAAPGLTSDQRTFKAALRGSGGYKELRRQLLHSVASGRGQAASVARNALSLLRYD
jgi:DGQHR domain-containing protein